jgi:hypothetical protein
LELLRRFTAEKIEFAFPTRTIVVDPEALQSLTTDNRPPITGQSSARIQPPSTAID